MAGPGRALILVNGPAGSAVGERARWVSHAAGGAPVAYRNGGRGGAAARFLRALLTHRPRLVYLVDCAVATVVPALAARGLLRARIILDTGDATGALARASRHAWSPGVVAAGAVERIGYALASTVVARSRGLADHVRSLSGVSTVVIPDGFDPAWSGVREGAAWRRTWGFTDAHLVIGVVGAAHWTRRHRWCYGRDVIEAVAACRRPDARGAVVVRGDGLPHLRELAASRGVRERIVFAEPAEGEQLWEQLGAIDVALSTQTDDAVGRARTTGKLVQYLAAGKYVLASRAGTAAEVLPDAMLVDYHGAWDEDYFARLAERIDALPERLPVRHHGASLSPTSSAFSYPALMDRLRHELLAETGAR